MTEKQSKRLHLPADLSVGAVLLLCAVLAAYHLEWNGPIVPVFGAAASAWLYRKEQENPAVVRAKVVGAIYSLLVSLAIVIGKDVQFSGGMRDGPDVNYIDWGAGSAVAALALAVLLYPAVTALLRLTARFRIPTAAARTPDNRVFLIMWGLIFICWTRICSPFIRRVSWGTGPSPWRKQ